MGTGAAADVAGHRSAGKHKEYEKKVRAERAGMPEKKAEQAEAKAEAEAAHEKEMEAGKKKRAEFQSKLAAIRERVAQGKKEKQGTEPDPYAATIDESGGGKIPTTSEALASQRGTVRQKPISSSRGTKLEKPVKKGLGLYLADPDRPFGGLT